MENQKRNGGLIAALVVFVILTICFGGYIAYDKLSTNNESNKNSHETSNKEENNSNETSNKGENNSNSNSNPVEAPSKISVVDFYFDSVAIVNEGSVYVNVYGSTTQVDELFGEGTYQTLVKTTNNYKEYSFNNFEYSKGNSKLKTMKLNVTNVEKVYAYEYGQVIPDNYGLILLNKDNTLSVISLYSLINGKTDVTAIPNLSDVESVVYENMNTYAVKKNGEKVDLNSYIPKDYKKF